MKSVSRCLIPLVLLFPLSACSAPPSYDEVRRDTLDVMQTVADLIPEPKIVRPRPEFEPYGCGDGLLGMNQAGAFYTGYWEVEVVNGMDISKFVETLGNELGDGWEEQSQPIKVSYPQTNLVHTATGVNVTVEESERDGKTGIDILAMSRCGVEDSERKS